jgi:N-acetylornithine carbamoyltransferase
MNEFYDLADFSPNEIQELLDLASRLQVNPEPRSLEGKVLALLFMSPSLRTLASFQAAMVRLGGGAFVISPNMSIHGIETRPGIVMDGMAAEHIREAVPVIASYADLIGIRAFAERRNFEEDLADREYNDMRSLCQIPLINMESAINHPCQSLADWKTMDDLGLPRAGGKFVLSWAFHPRALPLAGYAGYGRHGIAARWICAAGLDHAEGAASGGGIRRVLARNRGSCGGSGWRAGYLCQVLVFHAPLRRSGPRSRAAG